MTNTAETEYAELIERLRLLAPGYHPLMDVAAYKISTLLAENARLKEALTGIAEQRLWDEMSEEEKEHADLEDCVRRARAALHGDPHLVQPQQSPGEPKCDHPGSEVVK